MSKKPSSYDELLFKRSPYSSWITTYFYKLLRDNFKFTQLVFDKLSLNSNDRKIYNGFRTKYRKLCEEYYEQTIFRDNPK